MRDRVSLERTSQMLATAFGEAINAALADPDVTEISINPDGHLWIERHGAGRACAGFALSAQDAERVIRLVATHRGREATALSPIVSAELPMHGERFEGVLPPLTEAPTFSIRNPASRIYSLGDNVTQGVMSAHTA